MGIFSEPKGKAEEKILNPYGCAKLRMTEMSQVEQSSCNAKGETCESI